MGLRILVTGSRGFIGSHVVQGLRERHEVLAPTHGELDLLDAEALEAWLSRTPVDVVVHAATWDATPTATRDPQAVLDHNLRMFANLLRARSRFGRLIHFGSGAEFAREHWREDLDESELGRHVPSDPYGFSKYWIAQLTESLPEVLNLRLFGVFGPGEDWRLRFISHTLCRLLHGLPATLRQDRRFDYLHVADVVDALVRVLDRPELQGNLNLCRGRVEALSAIAAMAAKALDLPLELEVKAPGEDRAYGGRCDRFHALVPEWQPAPLERSIRTLAAHYRTHLSRVPRAALLSLS